ncbi:HNH endonuclease domain-containing protein [Butyribacter intestini]|uniref:HNH endonuclease domain-containing protein n=1 Tax=Butyribacter intestini TaxID=1703332 RepID=UPI003AF15D6C
MDIQHLKYKNELNIDSFIHMLDDTTECYKFYWLDALLKLFSLGKTEIVFDDLINQMIADAWYSVVEYHLHLGPKNASGKIMNSLERAVIKLSQLTNIPNDADRDTIILAVKENDRELHGEKDQLTKNVPYRMLSSFMHEIKGNDRIWDQKKRLIAYIEQLNKKECIPYQITDGAGLKKHVVINEEWQDFFMDNFVTISGWIEVKKVRYLQGRNPGVPGIIYKLVPENNKQRKLRYVRNLWNTIIETKPVYDIYSEKLLGLNDFDIDHFVPWSFVANDELWNLLPMDSSLNSSKSNNLPQWKYFELFAKNQYMMYESAKSSEKIMDKFKKCQRDNLVMPWSMEELYIAENDREAFIKVLEEKLHPVYDSARIQGYEIWRM